MGVCWGGTREDVYYAGPKGMFQEPAFIRKDGEGEGKGWIKALVNHLDGLKNDIVILML